MTLIYEVQDVSLLENQRSVRDTIVHTCKSQHIQCVRSVYGYTSRRLDVHVVCIRMCSSDEYVRVLVLAAVEVVGAPAPGRQTHRLPGRRGRVSDVDAIDDILYNWLLFCSAVVSFALTQVLRCPELYRSRARSL